MSPGDIPEATKNTARLSSLRDWEQETNGSEFPNFPFRKGKKEVPLEVPRKFRTEFPEILIHLISNQNFRGFGANGKHPWTTSQDVPMILEIFRSGKPK